MVRGYTLLLAERAVEAARQLVGERSALVERAGMTGASAQLKIMVERHGSLQGAGCSG